MKRKPMKFLLKLEVDVNLNGTNPKEIKGAIEYIKDALEYGVREMFGQGDVTGSTEAEVESWDVRVDVPVIGKCPACGREGVVEEGCPSCPGFWFASGDGIVLGKDEE